MKKYIAFLIAALPLWADITDPYTPPFYAGYEERAEAHGYALTYGDSAYGTFLNLSGTIRFSGDSAVVGFVLRQNCQTNQPDSCYTPHRAYVLPFMLGYTFAGPVTTTNVVGHAIQCPAWFQTWYYVTGMTLHGHGQGLIDDWNSILTVGGTPTIDSVVTVNEDTLGYIYLEQVPLFGQSIHTYQAGPGNDPTGYKRMSHGAWHLIQVFYDTQICHCARVWMDGKLESTANISGRTSYVANFHAGLYASPAVTSGTVLNDETQFFPVLDSLEGQFRTMATPPLR